MRRRRSALLWGAVGALAFLVLHQGYLLVGGSFLGFGPIVGVTGVVFGASTASAFVLEPRINQLVYVNRYGDDDALR